jgi:hypothetical protein
MDLNAGGSLDHPLTVHFDISGFRELKGRRFCIKVHKVAKGEEFRYSDIRFDISTLRVS